MKCPVCKQSGDKSRLVYMYNTSTLIGGSQTYYDEDGVLHMHDPNTNTSVYQCSNGHEIARDTRQPCPACDYGKKLKPVIRVISHDPTRYV